MRVDPYSSEKMTLLHLAATHDDADFAKVIHALPRVISGEYLIVIHQQSQGESRQQESLHISSRGERDQQGGDDLPAGESGGRPGVAGTGQQDCPAGGGSQRSSLGSPETHSAQC